MSQSLPFCSAEPLVANSIQAQSYLQDYSTSVHLYKEETEDARGMAPEQQHVLLLELSLPHIPTSLLVLLSTYLGGKTGKNVD